METASEREASAELPYEALLGFFKALAHPARLRIAGELAHGPRSLVELAGASGEPRAAVPRHLALLVEAGVVLDLGRGSYALDAEGLRRRASRALDSPRSRALAGAKDERSKVLASFFRDGRLTGGPSGDQRRLIVLEEIVARFERGRTYTEREVNDIIKPIFEDYTTIRRALVDYHFMNRSEGIYWLGEGRVAAQAATRNEAAR